MFNKLQELLERLENSLYAIQREGLSPWEKAIKSFDQVRDSYKVFSEIAEKECKALSLKDQIRFFKDFKIPLHSKLFYYIGIYDIEIKKPLGLDKAKKQYLKKYINRIEEHCKQHKSIHQYYNINATDWDKKFFSLIPKFSVRYDENGDSTICTDNYSSTHDILFARIYANNALNEYLHEELEYLRRKSNGDILPINRSIKWTCSKSNLIELIYALHSKGVINNGNTNIKQLANLFEKIFNIDLGDYYRTWVDLKLRANPTRFLDALKSNLQEKVDSDDDLVHE